jgi:hypothetical protein
MRMIDFSDWHAVVSTLASLALITVIGMGLRVLLMMTVQERRQRQNRQINERLKVLIAAYKTLGGSFTGDLTVNPQHMRDIRRAEGRRAGHEPTAESGEVATAEAAPFDLSTDLHAGSDRGRRIRDAVEAALSDILLLGTESQVLLAATALGELVEGRPVHTHELVIALRDFIREALDLDPIPAKVAASLPAQGPARPGGGGGSGGGQGRGSGGGGEGSGGGGGGGGGGGDGGGGIGGGLTVGGGIVAGASEAGHADHPAAGQ